MSGKIPSKIKLLEGDVGGIRMIWWKNLGIMEFKENVRPLWISMPHLPPPPHPPTHPSCKNIFWLPFRPLTALMTGYLNTKEITFCFIIMTDKNRLTPVSIFLPFTPLNQLHILWTDLYTFPKVLTRKICFKIKSLFCWWPFPLFLWPKCLIQGWYCKEILDPSLRV